MTLQDLLVEPLRWAWSFGPTLPYLTALLVAVGTAVGLRHLKHNLTARLAPLASRTSHVLDDLLLDMLRRTRWFFTVAIGVYAGRLLVDLPPGWDARIHNACVVLLFLQAGLWASGAVDRTIVLVLEKRAPNDEVAHTGRNIMRALGITGVWALAGLLCLDNVGVDVSALIAGLGITGVALAFAGQQIGGDIFASASILLDQPFLVGDFIIVENLRGTIERIGVRTTHLRSIDGERIVFANADLARSRLRNFRTMRERRVLFEFAIRHDTPRSRIQRLGPRLEALLTPIPKTRFERATWREFARHGLVFEVVYYVLDNDLILYMQTQEQVNLTILEALEAEDIRLAEGVAVRMVTDGGDEAPAAHAALGGAAAP